MKKICCIKCNKYRKFKNLKLPYILDIKLFVFIICDKCGSNNEKTFKEEESIEILKFLLSIKDMEHYQIKI